MLGTLKVKEEWHSLADGDIVVLNRKKEPGCCYFHIHSSKAKVWGTIYLYFQLIMYSMHVQYAYFYYCT